ncbi:hypothetical protein PENSPDRAFT_645988 [Peniophora sp. CONT]|nr:hypothetical protein PENSPDRAFT_645988 [Peniophora sp. CONT]
MAEVVNVVVALVVIVFVVRWATQSGGEDTPEQAAARSLKFKPKRVTPEMIDTVTSMFPDIPRANVHYDLLRTGSTEQTATKILERGFLDAPPPAYFTLYPSTNAPAQPGRPAARPPIPTTSSAKARETLIQRYKLEDKLDTTAPVTEDAGGKAVWEDTAEKREASLRARKQQMILAARQRMLEQKQKAEKEKSA